MSKYRKMLSSWEAPYLQSLIKLMESQSKTTLIMWVLDYAEMALLPIWVNERADDVRPQATIQAARSWLRGEVKLPVAKQKYLRFMPLLENWMINPFYKALPEQLLKVPPLFICQDTRLAWHFMGH